jgi:hypothetical protein
MGLLVWVLLVALLVRLELLRLLPDKVLLILQCLQKHLPPQELRRGIC